MKLQKKEKNRVRMETYLQELRTKIIHILTRDGVFEGVSVAMAIVDLVQAGIQYCIKRCWMAVRSRHKDDFVFRDLIFITVRRFDVGLEI